LSAYTAFDAALEDAEKIGDLYGLALANLNLGALYRDEQHRSEALYLTRLARRAAEGVDAPELLYRAHWQEGQILWSEHQVSAALAAHRRAIAILEETKPVASDGYGSSGSSFRMAVGAVYQDTVDLMLRAATLANNDRTSDRLIVEARNTLEKLKAAELRDYFEDECIASVSGDGRGIDELGDDAAVVYTVTLPDRVELLVGLPSGIERFTTKVSAVRLNETVDLFRNAVQNPLTNDHRALGRKLYEWTVAPYAERVAEAGIKTLVFIPDGRLRTLPFAALNDGDAYLSENFATATALSLRLLAPPELESEAGRPVLAGVSESVQGFSALAAVDAELAEIQAIEGGELLLNKDFTLEGIRAAVMDEIPGVVHLATHAVFTGNPDTSFLLTYTGRVGFDDLSDVIGMTNADGAPLELLVLSACETAVGNDRAGLGFTGSAIRAGARSALGSLWPISDAAAGALMIDFYRGLQRPELTKAKALQNAQATLRKNERFAHPFYWAPFTLVNDWL
jgi:CHAT domain-containing protein